MFRALIMILFGAAAFAQGSGKWKVNLEKSKFEPGPGPASETYTFEVSPGGQINTRFWTGRDGRQLTERMVLVFDGKWHPLARQRHADEICTREISDRVVVSSFKRKGTVVLTSTRVVAVDGNTMTITLEGEGVDGRIHNVRVLERQ